MPTGGSGTFHLAWGTTFAVVISTSVGSQGLQHNRIPCPSLFLVFSLMSWCHPIISCSVVPFPSCPQSFPGSKSFPMNPFFASGGQSIGASASASVLPMSIQGCFPLGLTSLSSLLSKGLSRVFSRTTVWKHQFFSTHFFMVQLSHMYMTTRRTVALTIQTLVGKVMSILFNTMARLVMAFLPRGSGEA